MTVESSYIPFFHRIAHPIRPLVSPLAPRIQVFLVSEFGVSSPARVNIVMTILSRKDYASFAHIDRSEGNYTISLE